MHLRSMVILLAAIPLVLSLIAVALIFRVNTSKLIVDQISAIQPILTDARKGELKNFVKIARGVVIDIYKKSDDLEVAKNIALNQLRSMDFGDDNYLFVYDLHGKSLMHPRLPHLEGNIQIDLRDKSGTPIIRNLISKAQAGGGFVEYMWNRPSTGIDEPKIGYVELIPEWGWVIGTGLYTNDLRETKILLTNAVAGASKTTLDHILIVASIAIIFVTVGGIALNLYERRSVDAKLRAMANKVVISQKNERTRVARDLHDGVIQILASVKFVFESALIKIERDSEDAGLTVRQGIGQLRGAMREVRRISHDLRPILLNDIGLAEAIRQISRDFYNRTFIETSTQIAHLPNLPDIISTAIFRVTQEAMGNVEKHSKATHLWIEITYEIDQFCICITDNGIGFDVQGMLLGQKTGLGLTNMRERIEAIGGNLEIISRFGDTRIIAKLTVNSNEV
jgi:two-component system NarL family sensor kinase